MRLNAGAQSYGMIPPTPSMPIMSSGLMLGSGSPQQQQQSNVLNLNPGQQQPQYGQNPQAAQNYAQPQQQGSPQYGQPQGYGQGGGQNGQNGQNGGQGSPDDFDSF